MYWNGPPTVSVESYAQDICVFIYIYNNTIHSICIYMHCIYIYINMYGQNVIHRILMHDFSLIDLQMSCSRVVEAKGIEQLAKEVETGASRRKEMEVRSRKREMSISWFKRIKINYGDILLGYVMIVIGDMMIMSRGGISMEIAGKMEHQWASNSWAIEQQSFGWGFLHCGFAV